MKKRSWLAALLLALPAAGQEPSAASAESDSSLVDLVRHHHEDSNGDEDKPKLDPKRIINESNGFLKEREPEMNAEEYAIYEKVTAMLASNPAFAVTLLEGMMNDKEPPSPAFAFILGNAYYSAGDLDKAEERFKSAVDRYPTFLRAWNNLGILYYSARKYPEAIACLSKCVTLGDRDPATFGLLGYCLEQTGGVVQAEMAYMQALSGDPANSDWMEGLLRIYVEGKQYGRAEWLAKDLIRKEPKTTRFWLIYAGIMVNSNRKLEAMALLETAVTAGVAGPNELNYLADLYANEQLVPEAIAIYRRIMVDNPDIGEGKLLNLAKSEVYAGDLPEAQQVLDALSAKISAKGHVEFLQVQADLLAAQNQWPQARKVLQELLTESPMNGQGLLSLGHTYAAEDDFARAELTFEEASHVPDSTYRANLELAQLELKDRHYDKAVQYLENALAIEKSPPVEDLLARVKPLATGGELSGD